MAKAAPIEPMTMQCGFCLQRDSSLVDPKTLPCSHNCCMECVTAHYDMYRTIRCSTCSEVYDVTPESLPSAGSINEDSMCCDVCVRKGGDNQPAVIYCTTCSKKYCEKHKQNHDDVLEDHFRVGINEYRTQARKLETRTCEKHKDEPYAGGCKTCLALFCTKCMFGTAATCTDGRSHDLLALDELVVLLTKDINELKEELLNKEEKLSDLFKSASKIRSDYERETEEMVETLRKTRDKQIEAIKEKYNVLEKELVRLRAETVAHVAKFMEEDVWVHMSNLDRHQLRIEAGFRHNHKVDIVSGYRDAKNEMRELIDRGIPTLKLQNSATLISTDERRDIEMNIGSVEGGFIGLEDELAAPKPLPKSLKLLRTVEVSSSCVSVSYYEGKTYAGLWAGSTWSIDRIDENYKLTKSFVKVDNYLRSSAVYKDRVYAVVMGSPDVVNVYNLSGQLITHWSHTDSASNSSSLIVTADHVVIPDRLNKRLVIYSLTGQTIKHVPCPQISGGWVALCAVDRDSVIVVHSGSSQVFRVNITTDEVMWTSKHITKPQGVTCYGDNYVLVASQWCNKIRILDVSSGDVLSEIADDGISGGTDVLDLHITGDTLIVPTYDNRKVLFYQLE